MKTSKEYDPQVYPVKLIIFVGISREEITSRFINMETEDRSWGDAEDFERCATSVNLVKDKQDNNAHKVIMTFSDENQIDFRNICHESFHAAISIGSHCNMSLGFDIGQDEHFAYICGWVGNCISDFLTNIDKNVLT